MNDLWNWLTENERDGDYYTAELRIRRRSPAAVADALNGKVGRFPVLVIKLDSSTAGNDLEPDLANQAAEVFKHIAKMQGSST